MLTQNSAKDITFQCKIGKVHICVSSPTYSVDYLSDEGYSDDSTGYYLGSFNTKERYCDDAEFYDNDNGFVKVAEYRNGEFRRIGTNTCTWVDNLGAYLKEHL